MKKILLVKLTSMGDLIQFLPALTDAAQAIPGIQFDWVIEESFTDVARLHPTIDNIISLPYRRWKKNKIQALRSGEISDFWKRLRHQQYDLVIDTQSNLKSAFVTRLTRGLRLGLDAKSVREYGAHFAYQKTISVNRDQNHAARLRQLMATHLGYELPKTPAHYGINKATLPVLDFELPEQFIFITHICSTPIKLWPEPFWQTVVDDIASSGFSIILPWWSAEEKARSLRLKSNHDNVQLLPPLNLTEKASVISKATACISLDTGLAHMAAALDIPNVTLYGSTNPKHVGAYGANQIHVSATGPSCSPCIKTNCTYEGFSNYKPACMETITPQEVLRAFYACLEGVRKVPAFGV